MFTPFLAGIALVAFAYKYLADLPSPVRASTIQQQKTTEAEIDMSKAERIDGKAIMDYVMRNGKLNGKARRVEIDVDAEGRPCLYIYINDKVMQIYPADLLANV